MKYAFFVILEDNPNEQKVIDEISNQGVEATLIPSSSLKGKFFANNTEPSPMFGGLRTIINDELLGHTIILMLVEEYRIQDIKNLIMQTTENFTKVKGTMFALETMFSEGKLD